jgi:hypothetical protein
MLLEGKLSAADILIKAAVQYFTTKKIKKVFGLFLLMF